MTSTEHSHEASGSPQGVGDCPFIRCLLASDGSPITGNRAWTEYSGLEPRRFRREGWAAVLRPSDRVALDEAREAAASLGEPFELDLEVRRVDGEYRWCQLHGAPMLVESDARPQWIVWMVDVHRHKRRLVELELTIQEHVASLAQYAHDVRDPLQTMQHALHALQLVGGTGGPSLRLVQVLERQVDVTTRQMQQYAEECQALAERLTPPPASTPHMSAPRPE